MDQYLPYILQLVVGAIGGNVAGKLLKNLSLGTVGNSIAGILGGGIGGQTLAMLGIGSGAATGADMTGTIEATEGIDMSVILGNVASGGIGGGVLMAIIGLIKNTMAK